MHIRDLKYLADVLVCKHVAHKSPCKLQGAPVLRLWPAVVRSDQESIGARMAQQLRVFVTWKNMWMLILGKISCLRICLFPARCGSYSVQQYYMWLLKVKKKEWCSKISGNQEKHRCTSSSAYVSLLNKNCFRWLHSFFLGGGRGDCYFGW